jgi:hypothetical protein
VRTTSHLPGIRAHNHASRVSVDNTVHSANISESDTVPGDGATKAVVVNVLDGTLNGAKDEMPEQVSATDACAGLKFWPRAPRGNPTGKPSQPADSPKPRKSVTVKARAERSDPRHSSRPAAPHTPAQGRSAKKQGGGGCVIA